VQIDAATLGHRVVDRVAEVDLRERDGLAVVRFVDEAITVERAHRGVCRLGVEVRDFGQHVDVHRLAVDRRDLENASLRRRERLDALHQNRAEAAGHAQRADAIDVRGPPARLPCR
jgi:hypothetical protein